MALKWKFATTWALIALVLSTAIILFFPSAGLSAKPIKARARLNAQFGANFTDRHWGRAPLGEGIAYDPSKYASDDMFNQYITKGARLQCLMHATDQGAGWMLEDRRNPPSAQSQWSDNWIRDLEAWYWHRGPFNQEGWADFDRLGLGDAFRALGLDPRPLCDDEGHDLGGDNFGYAVEHVDKSDYRVPDDPMSGMVPLMDQKYTVNGKQYMATGGFFEFTINTVDGVIFAININSPAMTAFQLEPWGRAPTIDELPKLRTLSDILWGFWAQDNPNPKNLRFYGAEHVVNDETVFLVSRAFRNIKVWQVSEWPGVSFDWNTNEGRAIIASPIGASIAWLLIQRKQELGIKHISKVNIFTNKQERPTNPMYWWMHIIFTIEDVPWDLITNEEGSSERKARKRDEEAMIEIVRQYSSFNNSELLHVRNEGKDILMEHRVWL